ncbi:DoxX family protein [Flavobacterium aquiphilum]|uniref:DoxX family protein n=1 Tax=Flavobacterium aquiphilum TaxID=3003261 RepID=UPI002480CCAD|nr:DoxX family protein [Flavobacterium aquiphilum]
MKKDKIIYWLSTALVTVGMLLSAYQYFNGTYMAEAYKQMGYPDFLRVEIGIAKIIGAIVLLLPVLPSKIKEWAYAGFGILFFSAALTHFLLKDPTERIITPLVFLMLLIVSNIYYSKVSTKNK